MLHFDLVTVQYKMQV